ncbi:MAG TPA: sigma factor, partial [Polyangiales bacterium]|nr:sigma factor [Polyangiales bacterium]
MEHTLTEITLELVAEAAGGDRAAVERIVRSIERPVYAVALRMLMEPRDAEDATQEALIRIVTRLAQFRARSRSRVSRRRSSRSSRARATRSCVPKLLFTATPGGLMSPALIAWCRAQLPNLEVLDVGAGIHYL